MGRAQSWRGPLQGDGGLTARGDPDLFAAAEVRSVGIGDGVGVSMPLAPDGSSAAGLGKRGIRREMGAGGIGMDQYRAGNVARRRAAGSSESDGQGGEHQRRLACGVGQRPGRVLAVGALGADEGVPDKCVIG